MLAARNALSEALAGRDLASIQSALTKATAAKVEDAEVIASAKALIATLEKEKEAVAALMAACDARTLAALESALAAATALGLTEESTPEVATANTLKNSLIAEQACKGALTKATAAKDADALSKGLAEAQQLGLSGAEVSSRACVCLCTGACVGRALLRVPDYEIFFLLLPRKSCPASWGSEVILTCIGMSMHH